MARTAPLLTLALLLLAGCVEQADDGTGAATPPLQRSAPAPRWENVTLTSDYDLRTETCAAVTGTTWQKVPPMPIHPQQGDAGFKATFTWTASNPTEQEMRIALVEADDEGAVFAEAAGASPLVLVATAQDLADAGAPDPVGLVVKLVVCHGTPSAGVSAMRQVAAAILWNPPS